MPVNELALEYSQMYDLLGLIEDNTISVNAAYQTIFDELVKNDDTSPIDIAQKLGLVQSSDEDELATWVNEVITDFPDKVKAYQGGKKGLLGFFMGEIMKRSKGKANPKKTNTLLVKKLER